MPTQRHGTATPEDRDKREKRDVRQEATDRIITAVEENTAPWQRPYDGGPRSGPINAVTGKEYNGGNRMLLATVAPTGDPRWVTYKQAAEQDWQVKKGEHGIPIEVWKSYEKGIERPGGENPKFEGKEIAVSGKEVRRFAKYYTVFHASQIDGIPPYEMDPSKTHDFDMHAVGEKLFDQNEKSAPVLFDSPGRAFYSPKNDDIHLPFRESFLDAGHLYATAAHEIAHSTMAEHRLNRSRLQQFQNGTASDHTLRAKEELRAEMASYIISEKTGIPHHPENHESYVKGWVSILKNDKNEIYHAARDAEKMADYVIAQQKLLEVGQEKAIEAPERIKQVHHRVILSHRKDLPDYVRQEPVDPDKPILEIQNHNRQIISGVLKDFEKDSLLLDTKEYGVVHVDIGKRFMEDGFGGSYLHKAMDKHIDVSISNDGRILKIHNPELGPQPATDIFDTPAKPFGLMPFRQMDRADAMQITGKLTHVHDTNLIEIQPAGKPMLISGRDPDKVHQAEIRAMVGHTVTVKPTKTGELKVEDRTPQKVKSLGR
ncbi:ArdC family protein [Acidithiobacillus sp.]|jgi:antirestriction protein ArdC|uniref:ArdC family protein n=1 Tax=Acidithiobacillus sp. TaxID=1872118 RepID=UPI0035684DDA